MDAFPGRTLALLLALTGTACGSSTGPESPPIFSEDFESGLSQWTGRQMGHHAQIVDDPLNPGNKVVNFTETVAAGDIFSVPIPVVEGEEYQLRFDYLGLPQEGSQPGNLGGFIGVSDGAFRAEIWLYGPAQNPATHLHDLVEDGHWHSYSVTFTPSAMFQLAEGTVYLLLEDGEGDLSVPGDAYFDNIEIYGPQPSTR